MRPKIFEGCLQLFGRNGYMDQYLGSRGDCGARVARDYAGTNEIMNVVTGRNP